MNAEPEIADQVGLPKWDGSGRQLSPVPAGLWMQAGASGLSAGAVPVMDELLEEDRCVLLLGGPGVPAPAPCDVAGMVHLLYPTMRRRLVVNLYGPEPDGQVTFAQQLADLLGVSVRARHGFTMPRSGGAPRRILIDRAGRPSWPPFVQLSVYHPRRSGATVEEWSEPVQGAEQVGRGAYRLTADWTVEVTPAGVLIRPATVRADPAWRAVPPDPEWVDLVIVVEPGEVLPDAVVSSLGRFADALPAEARSRLRVILTAPLAATSDRALRSAIPAPQQIRFAA